ncbi:efflux RND transporter periplasmic adaptor subunit [Phenylobacterium terrae]|uniref:Efflux RND transporter periplasmic adaptor subunit n=1 Tax=Phenylobacterium terrae TaxID=2665495 RepID=A0ABW4MYD7_9CAUL
MFAFLRRRPVWLIALFAVLLGVGVVVYSGQAKAKKDEAAAAAAKAAPPSPYVAVANGKADVEGGLIQVAARTAGIVREVYVHEGDTVTRGQALARLEDDQQRLNAQRALAELNQARAQIAMTEVELSTARREHERLKSLSASNFVAGQKLDQAADAIRQAEASLAAQRAAIATAQARLAQANYELELTIIRAPADGRIVRRQANPGAGASTLNVSNMFDLEPAGARIVRAEVAELALPSVTIGQAVQLSPEGDPSKVYSGRVVRRAGMFGARKLQSDDPTERADDRVVEVVVSADDTPFLIGQRVLVKFMRTDVAQR